MYTIKGYFMGNGPSTMNLTAETLAIARGKAKHLREEGFLVEIKDLDSSWKVSELDDNGEAMRAVVRTTSPHSARE